MKQSSEDSVRVATKPEQCSTGNMVSSSIPYGQVQVLVLEKLEEPEVMPN